MIFNRGKGTVKNWVFYSIAGLVMVGCAVTAICVGIFFIRKRVEDLTLTGTPVAQVETTDTTTVPTAAPPVATAISAGVTAAPRCPTAQGQVLDKAFYSKAAQAGVPYRIYLPPCYAQDNRRFPYVILLHGVGSDYTEWTDVLGVNQVLDRGIADGSIPPMILVMPNGGDPEYENYFAASQSFEALILNDLMPEIQNNYCTLDSQQWRSLAGISRGGFWVFEIGLRHPEVFSVLAGHSAYFDPQNAPAAYNPLSLAGTVTIANGLPHLWLDVAADDTDTKQGLDAFAQTIGGRGLVLNYTVYPDGGHLPTYWQSHLDTYLKFYGQGWPLNPQELPGCKT